jgi:diguanylate cyclase (GGDEF)-like protein
MHEMRDKSLGAEAIAVTGRFPSRKLEEPTPAQTTVEEAEEVDVRRLIHSLAWAIRYAVRQQEETERMRRLALMDELTGLYNRRGFILLSKQQLKLARRTNRNVLAVFVDVNGLKRINDTYGHVEGDRVLKHTANVLRKSVRDSDILGRVGGDEFMILAQEASVHSQHRITARLERNLKAHNEQLDQGRCALSLSFGFSPVGCRSSIEDLMMQADRDMYGRKRSLQSRFAATG